MCKFLSKNIEFDRLAIFRENIDFEKFHTFFKTNFIFDEKIKSFNFGIFLYTFCLSTTCKKNLNKANLFQELFCLKEGL